MLSMDPPANRLFTTDDRVFLQAVVRAGYTNPFTSARVEAERRVADRLAEMIVGAVHVAVTSADGNREAWWGARRS